MHDRSTESNAPCASVRTLAAFFAIALIATTFGAPVRASGTIPSIPAIERRLDADLSTVGARDGVPVALGDASGTACVLSIENFALRRVRTGSGLPSPDRATVYDASRVFDFLATQDGEDVTVALLVESFTAGYDVVVRSSDDLCTSWSPTVVVVAGGDGHPASFLTALDRGGGTVALVWNRGTPADPYLSVSPDGGDTWSGPLRVWGALAGPDGEDTSLDVEVGPAGAVCLGYLEPTSETAAGLRTARSLDGGLTLVDESVVSFPGRDVYAFAWADRPTTGVLLTAVASWDEATLTDGDLDLGVSGTGSGVAWCAGTGSNLNFDLPALSAGSVASATSRVDEDHLSFATALVDGTVAVTTSANGGFAWTIPATVGSGARAEISAARTDSGTWVLAWESTDVDPLLELAGRVFASTSTDGTTWSAPAGVSDDIGTLPADLGAMSATGGDDVLVPYRAFVGSGDETDIYAEHAAATTLGGSGDPRLDVDGPNVTPHAGRDVAVASDGDGLVVVAYTAVSGGRYPELFVARSVDGGLTFGPPVELGENDVFHGDVALAIEGSNVYLAFTYFDEITGLRPIAWQASNDGGVTWSPTSALNGFSWISGSGAGGPDRYDPLAPFPSLHVAGMSPNRMVLAYSDGQDVTVAVSQDGGATIAKLAPNADDTTDPATDVDLCLLDGEIVVSYRFGTSAELVKSDDDGETFSAGIPLSEPTAIVRDRPEMTCGGDRALVTYPDGSDLGWARYVLNDVLDPVTGFRAVSEPTSSVAFTGAAYVDDTTVVAAYDEQLGTESRQLVMRSTDGGATFGASVRVDTGPSASGKPVAAVPPGTIDEVHLYWSDAGTGVRFEPVVSRSTDGGVTWDAPRRIGGGSVCDGVLATGLMSPRNVAGSGTATVLAWVGNRDSETVDTLVNGVDGVDPDRDGSPAGADCAPDDPTVYPGAPEVLDGKDNQCPGAPGGGLIDELPPTVGFDDPTTLSWDPMPGATEYRVASSGAPTFDVVCTTETTPDPQLTVPATPAPGTVDYFLVQASMPSAGSWGADSSGVERPVSCAP